jgi:hypothetical protein
VIAVGKKALVIQHAATEGPGTIAPALRRFGLEAHTKGSPGRLKGIMH